MRLICTGYFLRSQCATAAVVFVSHFVHSFFVSSVAQQMKDAGSSINEVQTAIRSSGWKRGNAHTFLRLGYALGDFAQYYISLGGNADNEFFGCLESFYFPDGDAPHGFNKRELLGEVERLLRADGALELGDLAEPNKTPMCIENRNASGASLVSELTSARVASPRSEMGESHGDFECEHDQVCAEITPGKLDFQELLNSRELFKNLRERPSGRFLPTDFIKALGNESYDKLCTEHGVEFREF